MMRQFCLQVANISTTSEGLKEDGREDMRSDDYVAAVDFLDTLIFQARDLKKKYLTKEDQDNDAR
jgi:hypothetical protein